MATKGISMVDRIRIGKSEVRTDYLQTLKSAWANRRLVLFLGAGVSLPYGIPSWQELVLRMFYEEADPRFSNFPDEYRPGVASWMVESFDFSPTFLARLLRYRLERGRGSNRRHSGKTFPEAVRDSLYITCRREKPKSGAALPKIADLIQCSEDQGRCIQAVISFNFDDLLELEVQRRTNVDVASVYDNSRPEGGKLPIVHVHGYLPKEGSLPDTNIVFTEDEYHQLTFSSFHWSVADIVAYLRHYSVLFIGLSMTDPNLRRLVDATNVRLSKPKHILIRRDHDTSEPAIENAMADIEKRVDQQRPSASKKSREDKGEFAKALRTMTGRAHAYEREVFKDMGIGVMWIKDYEDIPKFLQKLGA
jgi:hypothetical protein